MSTRNIPGG